MSMCAKCGGWIGEEGKGAGYSGQWCYCQSGGRANDVGQNAENHTLHEIIRLKQAEIEALQKELKDKDELAQCWIVYATKIEMLLPTMWDSDSATLAGWSIEYLKGYNDAIREVNKAVREARK